MRKKDKEKMHDLEVELRMEIYDLENKINNLERDRIIVVGDKRLFWLGCDVPKISQKKAIQMILDHLGIKLTHSREKYSLTRIEDEKEG